MATTFDLTSYPLSSDTKVQSQPPIVRDVMDDGSPRIRVMGNEHATIQLFFNPMDASTAQAFEDYISVNFATEFDIDVNNQTYRGYLWSQLYIVPAHGPRSIAYQIDFYGRVV
jgi:hypothetical protein